MPLGTDYKMGVMYSLPYLIHWFATKSRYPRPKVFLSLLRIVTGTLTTYTSPLLNITRPRFPFVSFYADHSMGVMYSLPYLVRWFTPLLPYLPIEALARSLAHLTVHLL